MSYTKVLRKSWHILWKYRALWVFGLILALTTVSLEGAVLYRRADHTIQVPQRSIELSLPGGHVIKVPGRIQLEGTDFGRIVFNYRHRYDERLYRPGDIVISYDPPADLSFQSVWRNSQGRMHFSTFRVLPEIASSGMALAIVLAGLGLCLVVASRILRYVSEAALLRMVDNYEESGTKLSWRKGFAMGWSRSAWRIFLINWVVNLPAILGILALLALGLAPLLLWLSGNSIARVLGTVSTTGLLLVWIALTIVIGPVLSLVKRFSWRACALENLGVTTSIRRGFSVIRQHPKEVVVVWLIMVATSLVWPILVAPIGLLLAALGVVVGGLATLLAGQLVGLTLAWEGVMRWVLAGAFVGLPLLLLMLVVPLSFLGGLREVFQSSAWTLTYCDLRALERVEQAPLPELAASGAN